jgi:sensor c-di-GMP phosphodiesterase-like protein
MKTTVALLCIFIFSIFTDYAQYELENDCTHCTYVKKYEPKINQMADQPAPYIHDADSTLLIYPLLENADNPGERYIQDIKFIYKDLHYCSDLSKVTIVNNDTSFSNISLKRMSCKIVTVVRFTDEQRVILATKPTQKIIIENLVTDNIYEYTLKDSLYFIRNYKLEDGLVKTKPKPSVSKPKNSGFVK